MASMAQAIRMALHYAEDNLGLQEIFGEDVGPPLGGVFTVTQGLKTTWNSPLDERGIIGAAIGLGLSGRRCVAEIQFCDYIYNTIDLLKIGGMVSWTSNGDWCLPMTVKTPVGSGIRGSIYHSHSFDASMTHIPGWKIVMPSNPLDAYGLMLACMKEPNPTMYLEPKALLRVRGEERIPGEPEDEKSLREMIDMPILGSAAHDVEAPLARRPHRVRGADRRRQDGARRRACHRGELRPDPPALRAGRRPPPRGGRLGRGDRYAHALAL